MADLVPLEMNFCRRCGKPSKPAADYPSRYDCENGHYVYLKPAPTVAIFFVTPENNVLLSVRGIEPFKGMLDGFGGFLDGKETFEHAAVRELEEEASLGPEAYEPLRYLTSSTALYPYQGENLPVLTVSYWTRLKAGYEVTPADDSAGVKSVPLAEIDLASISADDTRAGIQVLQATLLSNEVERDTNVGTNNRS